jgi:DUF438 domain-containing protein
VWDFSDFQLNVMGSITIKPQHRKTILFEINFEALKTYDLYQILRRINRSPSSKNKPTQQRRKEQIKKVNHIVSTTSNFVHLMSNRERRLWGPILENHGMPFPLQISFFLY